MARVKRNAESGDNAILRAVSGCDNVRECGLHIAPQVTVERETMEDRYTLPSVYDGTDLAQLIADEREMTRKTENAYIGEFSFVRPLKGKIRLYKSPWAVVISEEGGATYKIGGSNIELNEPIPEATIEMDGDLMIERNGRVAGFALIGAHDTLVRRIRSDKRIWCAKVVPIGSVKKSIKL